MILNQRVNLRNSWPVDLVPNKKLYGVLPDGRNPEWGFKPRAVAPAPSVNRTGGIEDYKETMRRSPFLSAWQWFDVNLLSLAMYGKVYSKLLREQRDLILGKFKGMYAGNAFITNRAGVDEFNCYPCGGADAMRGSDPKIDPLICAYKPGSPRGGLQVLEIRENESGVEMGLINGFRYNSTPPTPNLDDPRVGWATTIEKNGNVSNFGWGDRFEPERRGEPLPYAIIQFEPCWYPMLGLEPFVYNPP